MRLEHGKQFSVEKARVSQHHKSNTTSQFLKKNSSKEKQIFLYNHKFNPPKEKHFYQSINQNGPL